MTTAAATVTPPSLSERAMLIKVTVHQWPARRNDRKLNAETAARHGADESMLRTTKDLIEREAFTKISALTSQIYKASFERSLPWFDGGTRILPSVFYFDTMAELKRLIHERENEVEEFLRAYDQHREKARITLNGIFDEADYPSVERLRRSFKAEIFILPMPSSTDFRVALPGQDAAAVQEQIDAIVASELDKAAKHTWQRIHDLVTRMSERLHSYSVTAEGKVEHTFRDSLVENIRDLIDILPGLNITGNADLDLITTRLRDGLTVYDAEALRTDEKARNLVADRADKILADIAGFLA